MSDVVRARRVRVTESIRLEMAHDAGQEMPAGEYTARELGDRVSFLDDNRKLIGSLPLARFDELLGRRSVVFISW